MSSCGIDFFKLCGTTLPFVQVPGETIGRAAGVDEAYLANFGEEVVRGHPMFVCSRLVQRLEGVLRECAGVGPWTSVSLGSGNGVAEGALLTSELATLQGAAGATAVAEAAGGTGGVVLLSEGLDGLEDVPPGVVAVRTTAFEQGRTHRWGIAWTFDQAIADELRARALRQAREGMDSGRGRGHGRMRGRDRGGGGKRRRKH